jgi:hypothetical protein
MSAAANNFRSIDLDAQTMANASFAEFVHTLHDKVKALKEEQSGFSEGLRRQNARWANGARKVLAVLGSIAFLLTAVAAAMRFIDSTTLVPGGDKAVLLAVLATYALMGTISFYDKSTDRTTTYFRHLTAIMSIRDLWTKYQFELLKELMAFKNSGDPVVAEPATRERIRALTEAFCSDLNKGSTSELGEFRTEFLASRSKLDEAAKKGDDVTSKLQDIAKAADKAAADAKAAAEKAASDAKAAAKAASDAAKPGSLNVTVSGDFDDQVAIAIDGTEVVRSPGRLIAIDKVVPGPRRIGARAKKGSKELEASLIIDVKPGLQDVKLPLG